MALDPLNLVVNLLVQVLPSIDRHLKEKNCFSFHVSQIIMKIIVLKIDFF